MKILLTGANGFLGRYIAKSLLNRGYSIRSFSRTYSDKLALLNIEQELGDLADQEAVMRAVSGCDAVIHTATHAGHWGVRDQFERTNIRGTINIIESCKKSSIKFLVYTSSPSVVFDQKSLRNADENTQYAKRYLADYPLTKAQAEKAVLSANSSTLRTIALRPHLLWGPGDNHIAPRLLRLARRGFLILPGNGRNMIDAVYVENAAHAHLDALDALISNPVHASGRAYFITNNQPVAISDMIKNLLKCYQSHPIKVLHLPASFSYFLGMTIECIFKTLKLSREPILTRFTAAQFSLDHFFNGQAAENYLGYRPRFTMTQGYDLLKEHRSDWITPN